MGGTICYAFMQAGGIVNDHLVGCFRHDGQGNVGWMLVAIGLVLAGIGLVWVLAPAVPWLGRLPGDIRIERENVRFYFPVVTCLLLSLVLTLVLWVVRSVRG